MRCALPDSFDHMSAEDRRELVRRLARLGVDADEVEGAPDAEAEVLVVHSRFAVNAMMLARLPRLRLVVTATSGHDHIDLDATERTGVRVARCPVARRDAVVDTSLAMALGLLRRLPRFQRRAARGEWARPEIRREAIPLVRELSVAILGHGVIGRRAADVWRALGAKTIVVDPAEPGTARLDDALPRADVVTLHCSLTESSRDLIDAAALARVKKGAVLVNTARGECLDLDAALGCDRLAGLGLDVFATEPFPRLPELAARDDVLLLPHSAGYHAGLGRALAREVAATVESFLAHGTMTHEVVRA